MATKQENLDHIADQPRGATFYCPALSEYGIDRRRAKSLARDGFDVIAEDAITISV